MPATVQDLTIEQGATYNLIIDVLDGNGQALDLAGYTARMQIRASTAATETLAAYADEFSVAANRLILQVEAEDTTDYTFTRGVYDLEIEHTATGYVTRLLQGRVRVSKEVTREVVVVP